MVGILSRYSMTQPLLSSPAAPTLINESSSTARDARALLPIADACFEMFSVRELKKPLSILPELKSAFPEWNESEIMQAVSLALSWKRLLRAAGKPLH
jgi:hypothetical protein